MKRTVKEQDVYDKAKAYRESVEPLMNEIREQCIALKIPFFASFSVAADGISKVTCINSALTPTDLGMKMANCEVVPLMHIAGGGKAVPASELAEIEID